MSPNLNPSLEQACFVRAPTRPALTHWGNSGPDPGSRGKRTNMRFRRLSLLLLCVSLAGSLAGQNENWISYKNDAGNFRVQMPAQPNETTAPGESGVSESHTVMAISGGAGYTVVYVTFSSDQTVDEATYNVYRDSFMKNLPSCQQESERAAAPDLPGYIGHWYRMNCQVSGKAMTFVGDLYWGKHYAYAVMAIFPTAPSDPPGTQKFIGSFGVLGK